MTEEQILAKIRALDLPRPRPRDVGAFYATWLATVYERLSPDEQTQAITLGGVIHARSLRMVPVLGSVGDDGYISGLELGEGHTVASKNNPK